MEIFKKAPTKEQAEENMKHARHNCYICAIVLCAVCLLFFAALYFFWACPATILVPFQFVLLYVPACAGLQIWVLFHESFETYMNWAKYLESMTTPFGSSPAEKEKEND